MPEQADDTRKRVTQLAARDHHVDHAMLKEIFGTLKAVGQLLANGLLDDTRPGKAHDGTGLGQGDIAQHGEGRGDTAGGGIGEQHDIGQAGFLHHLNGERGARQLHQRQDALLHACAAGSGDDDEGRFLQDRQPRCGQESLAYRHAHRPAHEVEIEGGDDGGNAADRAMRYDQGVATGTRFGLRLLEAIAVALAVAEFKWIGDRLGQFDARAAAFIEQQRQPLFGIEPQVMAATAADEEIGLEVAVEQHLAATRAFVPEILRHIFLRHDGADLRQDEVGKPAHRKTAFWRAPRTPAASARTSSSTAVTKPASGLPAASTCSARRCTSAEPTAAASATRATEAACSGERMPNPTAMGNDECRLRRATAAAISPELADLVPVMPAIET